MEVYRFLMGVLKFCEGWADKKDNIVNFIQTVSEHIGKLVQNQILSRNSPGESALSTEQSHFDDTRTFRFFFFKLLELFPLHDKNAMGGAKDSLNARLGIHVVDGENLCESIASTLIEELIRLYIEKGLHELREQLRKLLHQVKSEDEQLHKQPESAHQHQPETCKRELRLLQKRQRALHCELVKLDTLKQQIQTDPQVRKAREARELRELLRQVKMQDEQPESAHQRKLEQQRRKLEQQQLQLRALQREACKAREAREARELRELLPQVEMQDEQPESPHQRKLEQQLRKLELQQLQLRKLELQLRAEQQRKEREAKHQQQLKLRKQQLHDLQRCAQPLSQPEEKQHPREPQPPQRPHLHQPEERPKQLAKRLEDELQKILHEVSPK